MYNKSTVSFGCVLYLLYTDILM